VSLQPIAQKMTEYTWVLGGDVNDPTLIPTDKTDDESEEEDNTIANERSSMVDEKEEAKGSKDRWSGAARRARNTAILDLLLANGVQTVSGTDGKGTHTSGHTLDLFLSNNPSVVTETSVDRSGSELFGSDHYPIKAMLDINASNKPRAPKPQERWSIQSADWPGFRKGVSDTYKAELCNSHTGHATDQLNERIVSAITQSAKKWVGLTKCNRVNRDWYTRDCKRSFYDYVRSRKAHGINDERTIAKKKKMIKTLDDAKYAAWESWCNGIEKGGKIDWRMFKNMNKGSSNVSNNICDEGQAAPTNEKQSLNNLARYFAVSTFSQDNNSNRSRAAKREDGRVQREMERLRLPYSSIDSTSTMHDFSRLFGLKELKRAIFSLSPNKATGHDKIHTMMLRNLDNFMLLQLLELYNLSWSEGIVPSAWKRALTIPLYKKKGDRNKPENYRIISLNSVLQKAMEALVLDRLRTGIPEHYWSEDQYGFRKGRSCGQAITHLLGRIARAMQAKTYVRVAFLDLSKAFDTVDHDQLMVKLFAEFQVRGRAWRWLDGYLRNRSFYLRDKGNTSDTFNVSCGTPQGGILSPLLFLAVINEVGKIAKRHSCTAVMYADDIALFPDVGHDGEDGTPLMQKALDEIGQWAERQHMKINIKRGKSGVVCFADKNTHIDDEDVLLHLNGKELPVENRYTYLGVILDRNMDWSHHRSAELAKTTKAAAFVSKLCTTHSGLSPNVIITITKAVVMSQHAFAMGIIPRSATHDQKLLSASLRPVRAALRLPRNVHFDSLLCEINALDPLSRATKAATKAYIKAREYRERNLMNGYTNQGWEYILEQEEVRGYGQNITDSGKRNRRRYIRDFSAHMKTIATVDLLHRGDGQQFQWCDEVKEDPTVNLNQKFARKALNELFSKNWGSSMRYCMRSIHAAENVRITTPYYHRITTLPTARQLAAVRFDLISPWRKAQEARNGDKRSVTPICTLCQKNAPARACHYFECAATLNLHLDALTECERQGFDVKRLSFSRVVNAHYPGVPKDRRSDFAKICNNYILKVADFIMREAHDHVRVETGPDPVSGSENVCNAPD